MRRAAALVAFAWLAGCGPGAAPAGAEAEGVFARLAAEAEASGKMVVAGEDGFLFLASELRHLGVGRFWGDAAAGASRAAKPEWADPLPALLDFARQLEDAGVELLFVPVPAKAAAVPGSLPGVSRADGSRVDPWDARFYDVLRGEGIEVLDLLPGFADASFYCRTDSHWSGAGAERAAGEIARWVRARPWYAALARESFESQRREVTIDGDLRRMQSGSPAEKETLTLRFVGRGAGTALTPVEPSRESPVLLLGDSHGLVFHAGRDMHARGAGLPDQLALELGFPVDLVAVRGSGATPSRISLARRPDGLAGKRLVIWILSVREFTETPQGWREIPVVRPAP